jgi:hypothetical protein
MQTNFFKTKQCDELYEELKTCDVDDALDIISEIEDARREFDNNLPCFVKIRWSEAYLTDPLAFEQAHHEYTKELLAGRI